MNIRGVARSGGFRHLCVQRVYPTSLTLSLTCRMFGRVRASGASGRGKDRFATRPYTLHRLRYRAKSLPITPPGAQDRATADRSVTQKAETDD